MKHGEVITRPQTEDKIEAEKRGVITQKAIKLLMVEIAKSYDLSPEEALRLGIEFAAYNNEASFHFARSRDSGRPEHKLADTYRSGAGFWEKALVHTSKGDTSSLVSALNGHALENQTRSYDQPETMNQFGVKLMKLASTIPLKIQSEQANGLFPKPAWTDEKIIEAPEPDITPYVQKPLPRNKY